jgi:hypothetical protein
MTQDVDASMPVISLALLPDELSIYRFEPSVPVPNLAGSAGVWSMTRTARELSVVAAEGACSAADEEDPGWRCLYVEGPIPFDLPGIVAGLTAVIAAQGLPVFVVSTFDSDLLLLRGETLDQSLQALRVKGYSIHVQEGGKATDPLTVGDVEPTPADGRGRA